jgi:polyisoprenoid-binding protein YceI
MIAACSAAAAALLGAMALLVASPFPADLFRIEPGSLVRIDVGKGGAFGFAGHAHEVEAPVRGTVSIDRSDVARSSVTLEFDTTALRVTGKGDPARDVPEVQRVMLSDRVLDARRYPTIGFQSRRVTAAGPPGRTMTLLVTGDLTLHGATRPCAVPVEVTLLDDALTAEGTAMVKQTDFGIQPVTAAGGTVRVKDELRVTFKLHASRPR